MKQAKYETHVLALKAAQQIDLARRSKPYDEQVIEALLTSLKAGGDIEVAAEVRSLTPPDLSVLTRAISAYRGGQAPTSLQEVSDALLQLLNGLNSSLETKDEHELTQLIAFCVALNKETLACRYAATNQRHPVDLVRA